MPIYTITLAQQLLTTSTLSIKSTSREAAEERALAIASETDLEWEPESADEVYVLRTKKED